MTTLKHGTATHSKLCTSFSSSVAPQTKVNEHNLPFCWRYESLSGNVTIVIELLKSAELIIKDQFSRFSPAAVTLLIAFNPREQLICTRIKATPSVCTFSSYQSPHKTVECLTSYLFMLTIN